MVVASRTAAAGDFHPIAMKIQTPKKTGNNALDDQNETSVKFLREIVTECIRDLSLVQPLYSKMRDRMRDTNASSDGVEFKDVKVLKALDPDFVVNFLAQKSDMSVDEIVSAMGSDAEAPFQLLSFCTQLPLALRWPERLFSKEVTYRFFCSRNTQFNARAKDFKAKGGLNKNSLDWTKGCYTPEFDKTGVMIRVKHISGDVAEVPEGLTIRKNSASIIENWSDMTAVITQPLVAPLKFCALFSAGKTGPFKYPVVMKKCSELDKMVKLIADGYDEEKQKMASATSGVTSAAADKIQEMKKEQAQTRAKRAREAAKAALTAKKDAKKVKCA